MRKPGRGALYSCSSGRGVERTTWLGGGGTGAISRDFCWLKTRWALNCQFLLEFLSNRVSIRGPVPRC
jgi:hypothetical protein